MAPAARTSRGAVASGPAIVMAAAAAEAAIEAAIAARPAISRRRDLAATRACPCASAVAAAAA